MRTHEVAIGLPSYNEAERIGFVTQQVDRGLCDFFDSSSSVIVNLDSHSPDGTPDAFLQTKTATEKVSLAVGRGKGTALVDFWKYALDNGIPYIATIDADLSSITPRWVHQLIEPLQAGKADVTLPLYARNRFKANITNQFAYPLVLAAFGVEVRQPLAGEFGYSQGFYRYLLDQRKYDPTHKYGIDIFITLNALSGKFQIYHPDLKEKADKPSFYHQEETFLEVSQSGLLVAREGVLRGDFVGIKQPVGVEGYCSIDDSLSFPHKEEIPALLPRLYEQFERNSVLNKEYLGELEGAIRERVSPHANPDINKHLWTDVLERIFKKCFVPEFPIGKVAEISMVLLPIYRWRVITFWLSVESEPKEAVEEMVKEQAYLLKQKMGVNS